MRFFGGSENGVSVHTGKKYDSWESGTRDRNPQLVQIPMFLVVEGTLSVCWRMGPVAVSCQISR
jgi:hypothetical protein